MQVHYAVQTCTRNRETITSRYCGGTRGELAQKSLSSFFLSIEDCIKQQPAVKHHVNIVDDHSSSDHVDYLKYLVKYFNKGNLKVELTHTRETGICETIDACWRWLEDNGTQLVYQVQDDYLFDTTSIYETIDIFYQILNELNTHPIISPYNDPYLWSSTYKYKTTPRMIVPGKNRYWMQAYDLSCSFFTSKDQFSKHWDLYDKFKKLGAYHPTLESDTVNKILVNRGVLGLIPFPSTALHVQTELEKDPYINWKEIWNKIDLYEENRI